MKILFICKFNRFRSKVAEAIFKKLNKNSEHSAKSAGIIRGSSLDKVQVSVAKERGFPIVSGPKGLTTEMLKWQNMIVIVANDIPKEIFKDNERYGKKLVVWKIPDAKDDNRKEVEKIVSEIEKKVVGLVRELK